jgi:putative phage-type endonuclease
MSILIQAEQRSPEWFAARAGVVTASRFKDVLAKTRSGYAATRMNYMSEKVLERFTGKPVESIFTTKEMQWGTDNEPLARLEYELKTGNTVQETGLWLHEEIMAGASPDGFIDEDGCIEIKCPNTATHILTLQTKKIPYQYISQVQGQMWIAARKWCDFVSYDPRLPENAQMIIIRVERDDKYIEELEEEIKLFLDEVDEQVEFVKGYGEEV